MQMKSFDVIGMFKLIRDKVRQVRAEYLQFSSQKAAVAREN